MSWLTSTIDRLSGHEMAAWPLAPAPELTEITKALPVQGSDGPMPLR